MSALRSTVTVTKHSLFDPACTRFDGTRVPAWLRALLGWNCSACRGHQGSPAEGGKP